MSIRRSHSMLSRYCSWRKLMKLSSEAGGHRRRGVVPCNRTTLEQSTNVYQSSVSICSIVLDRWMIWARVKRWSPHTHTHNTQAEANDVDCQGIIIGRSTLIPRLRALRMSTLLASLAWIGPCTSAFSPSQLTPHARTTCSTRAQVF